MANMGKHQLRYELKYIITEGEYVAMRDRLLAAMPLDRNADASNRLYHIRSLYFDDIYNTSMTEKESGVMVRKKYRIRIYNLQDRVIHLEKKMKFDQMTAKDSTSLTRKMAEALIRGDWMNVPLGRDPLLDEFYADMRTRLLRPAVIVDYYREAYTFPAGNVRVTFDRDLHSGQFSRDLFADHPSPVPILDPGTMLLEIKYDNFLPAHLLGILQSHKGQRMAISKYTLCREYH